MHKKSLAGDTNWNSYETTMMHEYTPKRGEIPDIVRHTDFKGLGYSYKLNDPIHARTLYTEQFNWKPSSKDDMIRTATSSGTRTNKPHPSKEFMTWKLSQEGPKTVAERTAPCQKLTTVKKAESSLPDQEVETVRSSESSPWRIPATLKEIRKAIADQYTSRFREDYLDNSKFPSILLNHIWNQEHSKKQSTYERHYGKESLDLAMLLNSLNENEIKKYLEKVPEDERKLLQNFVNENYNRSGNKHK
ncbi:testis-expressed protein 26 isoform 4-T5 [Sarcophilus harrisii]